LEADEVRYNWSLPRPSAQSDESVQNRIRTISRYYVDWLSNVQSLQSRFLDQTAANQADPQRLRTRQQALAELNRTLAETESLTNRLGTLASDIESSIEQAWPSNSPCLYPGMAATFSPRRWNCNRRASSTFNGSDLDYEGLLRDGRLDKNGCEIADWDEEMLANRVIMEADR